MARRVEGRRNRFRDFFLCSLPVAIVMAFLYVLVSSSIFGFYTPNVPSSSFESTYYKCLTQMLDALNGTTTASDSNPLSIEAIRKKDPSLSWRVEDEVESHASSEDQMVNNFVHGTWTRERGGQVLNDTPEKLYQRRMRQERREKRAKELMNNDNIEALEKAAIQRSRSVDSVAPGNYSIWRNDYHKGKNFEDLLRLLKDQIIMVRVYTSLAKMTNNLALHKELETKLALMEEEESISIDQQERVLDTIREMGQLLARAKEKLHDCNLVTNKLRAMLQTAEEELLHTQTHVTFLNQLASKSVPHAIHCLTMTLNLDYSLLPAPMRHFPRTENLEDPDLYHYALFSDNVLARIGCCQLHSHQRRGTFAPCLPPRD
ncbi:hypothetical protein Bca4012_034857 [Brassica carinata]